MGGRSFVTMQSCSFGPAQVIRGLEALKAASVALVRNVDRRTGRANLEPARRAILAANLPADTAHDRLLDEVAAATEGLSGAHVREVAFLGVRNAILRDTCDATGLARPAAEDFTFAVDQVTARRGLLLGFRAR
jgi:hypothetical protein